MHNEILIQDLNALANKYTKKIKDYHKFMDKNPLSEIVELRRQLSEKVKCGTTTKEFADWLKFAAAQEKKLMNDAKKQHRFIMEDKDSHIINLEFALSDLRNIIFNYNRNN